MWTFLKKAIIWPIIWVVFWPLWTFFAFIAAVGLLGVLAINKLEDWRLGPELFGTTPGELVNRGRRGTGRKVGNVVGFNSKR